MLVLVIVLVVTNLATLGVLAYLYARPADGPRPDAVAAAALDRSPRPPTVMGGTRRMISIEILNPIELAGTKGRLAGIAGSLVPGLTRRIVYDQTLKILKQQLVDQQVVADVRLHTLRPVEAPARTERPTAAPTRSARPGPATRAAERAEPAAGPMVTERVTDVFVPVDEPTPGAAEAMQVDVEAEDREARQPGTAGPDSAGPDSVGPDSVGPGRASPSARPERSARPGSGSSRGSGPSRSAGSTRPARLGSGRDRREPSDDRDETSHRSRRRHRHHQERETTEPVAYTDEVETLDLGTVEGDQPSV